VLLSSDYTKSLHLQTDRFLEFHTPGGLHYTTRIPRYGRDLKYHRRAAEALIPSVGVNADGNGEVFRLNLELGRFMKGFEVDVGGDDYTSLGGGALQGGIRTGSVNCAAVAEESHGLLAFGTSLGTVEFWDARSRNRVSALGPPTSLLSSDADSDFRPEITALEFHRAGLNLATGSSTGIVHTYDLRSPVPLLKKDQGYDYPIQTLKYLTPSAGRAAPSGSSENLIMSADKRAIKIWDAANGNHWTSVEPAVDLNHVEWVPDSGMLLTANEGRQQHAFFIPQLGPAPKWCAFLDNLVEEMAEDAEDPNAFNAAKTAAGEVYDNYKFLDMKQMKELQLDQLIGQTNDLRPYMHGYFVSQRLYDEARLLHNPDIAEQQRQKTIQERINKERESRIRGSKKIAVKVNRKYAEKLAEREEANERRKAQRILRQGGDEARPAPAEGEEMEVDEAAPKKTERLLDDDRFRALFENEDFEIDETSREFAMHNPSTVVGAANGELKKRGLTAVEEDELDERRGSDNSDEDEDEDEDEEAEAAALRARQRPSRNDETEDSRKRIGNASYKKGGKTNKFKQPSGPQMRVSSSNQAFKKQKERASKSFGDLASSLPALSARERQSGGGMVVGEKEVTFAPTKPQKKGRQQQQQYDNGGQDGGGRSNKRGSFKDRRSASGNVFRRM
jgi:ribosome biogenesis protein ENP2